MSSQSSLKPMSESDYLSDEHDLKEIARNNHLYADKRFLAWVDARIGKPIGNFLTSYLEIAQNRLRLGGLPREIIRLDALLDCLRADANCSVRDSVMTVFHGTASSFESFDDKFSGSASGHPASGLGFHFTDSEDGANFYASLAGGSRVITAKVRLHNPRLYSFDEFNDVLDDIESGDVGAYDLKSNLEKEGFDGIIAQSEDGNCSDFIAFRSDQIEYVGDNLVLSKSHNKVVYHGTVYDFNEFVGDNAGTAWFTESLDHALTYANQSHGIVNRVIAATLTIENPLILEVDMNDPAISISDLANDFDLNDYVSSSDQVWEVVNTSAFSDAAAAAGFDGIYVKENGIATWNAFHNHQIECLDFNYDTHILKESISSNDSFSGSLNDEVSKLMEKKDCHSDSVRRFLQSAEKRNNSTKSNENTKDLLVSIMEQAVFDYLVNFQKEKDLLADFESFCM